MMILLIVLIFVLAIIGLQGIRDNKSLEVYRKLYHSAEDDNRMLRKFIEEFKKNNETRT